MVVLWGSVERGSSEIRMDEILRGGWKIWVWEEGGWDEGGWEVWVGDEEDSSEGGREVMGRD